MSEFGSAPAGDTDWSPVFRRARLDESDAVAIPILKQPPVYCDEVVAWRFDGLGKGDDPVTVQMGAVAGRPNYFEILELRDAMVWTKVDAQGALTTMARPVFVVQAIRILMIILAWRNLRGSRGDRRR